MLPILGTASLEHLEENWDARRIALTPDEVAAIGKPGERARSRSERAANSEREVSTVLAFKRCRHRFVATYAQKLRRSPPKCEKCSFRKQVLE
jgi:hypothetical protein